MKRADEFGKGVWVRQQMFYAALSLELYRRDPKGLDPLAVVRELQSKYTPFPYVEGTYFHLSFGHLDGYSAIYYTYMWSLVIAKDLFTVFQSKGLLNPEPAQAYRRAVLEPGGSKDAVRAGEGLPRPRLRLPRLRAVAQRGWRRRGAAERPSSSPRRFETAAGVPESEEEPLSAPRASASRARSPPRTA